MDRDARNCSSEPGRVDGVRRNLPTEKEGEVLVVIEAEK